MTEASKGYLGQAVGNKGGKAKLKADRNILL